MAFWCWCCINMFSEGKCFHIILRGEKEQRLNCQASYIEGWFPLAPLTDRRMTWINDSGGGQWVPLSSLSGRHPEHEWDGAWRPEKRRVCEGSCKETRQLSWNDYLHKKDWKITSLWGWYIRELVTLPETCTEIPVVFCWERMCSNPDFLFNTQTSGRQDRSAVPLLQNI